MRVLLFPTWLTIVGISCPWGNWRDAGLPGCVDRAAVTRRDRGLVHVAIDGTRCIIRVLRGDTYTQCLLLYNWSMEEQNDVSTGWNSNVLSVHTHIHMRSHINILTHMVTHPHIHTCTHISSHAGLQYRMVAQSRMEYTYIHLWNSKVTSHTHTHIHTHPPTHKHTHTLIHTHIYIYTYTNTHTHTHTHTHTTHTHTYYKM